MEKQLITVHSSLRQCALVAIGIMAGTKGKVRGDKEKCGREVGVDGWINKTLDMDKGDNYVPFFLYTLID